MSQCRRISTDTAAATILWIRAIWSARPNFIRWVTWTARTSISSWRRCRTRRWHSGIALWTATAMWTWQRRIRVIWKTIMGSISQRMRTRERLWHSRSWELWIRWDRSWAYLFRSRGSWRSTARRRRWSASWYRRAWVIYR